MKRFREGPVAKVGIRGQAKRLEILEAAREIFLTRGYAATTMDEITRAAGGSKATVYGHFENKEALFSAIVQERSRVLLEPVRERALEPGDFRSVLSAVARNFVSSVLKPDGLALYRVVLAEATRSPELGRVFYEHGPQQALSMLTEYLHEETHEGRLSVDDPAAASEQFFGMLLGLLHVRALLYLQPSPDQSAIERHVAQTVDTFIRAYSAPVTSQARASSTSPSHGRVSSRRARQKKSQR